MHSGQFITVHLGCPLDTGKSVWICWRIASKKLSCGHVCGTLSWLVIDGEGSQCIVGGAVPCTSEPRLYVTYFPLGWSIPGWCLGSLLSLSWLSPMPWFVTATEAKPEHQWKPAASFLLPLHHYSLSSICFKNSKNSLGPHYVFI